MHLLALDCNLIVIGVTAWFFRSQVTEESTKNAEEIPRF